jgi:hypothetical protein
LLEKGQRWRNGALEERLIGFCLKERRAVRVLRPGFSGERVDAVGTEKGFDVPRKAWAGLSNFLFISLPGS